jgi:hypothetical protein
VLTASGEEAAEVIASATFDATRPSAVAIEAPGQLIKGEPLSLSAKGLDAESGIEKVAFFIGKPTGDKPPMTEMFDAEPTDPQRTAWTARIPLKPDQKMLDVSVQFTNGVGLVAFDTVTIQLKDPPPPPTTGTIKGKVFENNRLQPKLKVSLLDAEKKEKDQTTTNDKGEFEFKDVAPGSYVVSCKKTSAQTSGKTEVAVEKGKTKEVKIELSRPPS